MAYQDTWDEITSDPRWESLSPAKKAKASRKFAQQVRKTEGKEAAREFIAQHVVTTPKPTNTRVRDNLVESFKENALPHYGDIAKGAARTLVDEGPTALVRRASGAVADAAYDAVAKPLGLPSAAEADKAMGRQPNRRLMPNTPVGDRTAGENIGGFVGQLADPINLAAPLNVFTKAAPVTKGINLLPKAPPPVAPQILKGMAGAGATNAAIAGVTSAGSQMLDGLEYDPQRTAIDASLGFAGGAVLGGPAAALNILARRDAAMRGFNAAQMDAAARAAAAPAPQLPAPKPLLALPPARSGPIIPSDGTVIPAPRGPVQMTPGVDPALLAARAADDYMLPSFEPDMPAPIQATAGPAPGKMTPGATLAERQAAQVEAEIAARLARAKRAQEEAARRMADSASADYLNAADDIPAPAPVQAASGPRHRGYAPGQTQAEREAVQAAEVEAARLAAQAGPLPDSPYLDTPTPRLHDNPLMDVRPDADAAPAGLDAVVPSAAAPKPKLMEFADTLEAQGRARLDSTRGRLYSTGMDPEVVLGHSEVLAANLLRYSIRKAEWAAALLEDFGDAIRPHLDEIWERAVKTARDFSERYQHNIQEPESRYRVAAERMSQASQEAERLKGEIRALNRLPKDERATRAGALEQAYDEARAIYRDAQASLRQAYRDMESVGFPGVRRKPGEIGAEDPRLDAEVGLSGEPRTVTAVPAPKRGISGSKLTKAGEKQRPARDLAAERADWEENRMLESAGGRDLTNRPYPRREGIAGKTLRRLVSEESGQAQMPSPDDVRAAANSAIDAGIDAADAAARMVRPIDQLIEQLINRSGVARPVGAVAGVVRRGKDAAKERLRTGVTGGQVEIADTVGRSLVSSKAPTQYQDLKDSIRSQTIRQMQGLTDEARRLEEGGVNQEALYDIVTDRNLSSEDAERVRNLTNQVSRDLLDVGNLTPEQYAAWEGQYLRRLYEHHENAIGKLSRKARKAVTLSGSKRRGTEDTMTPAALATRNRPWQEAGTMPDGRVILEDPTDGKRIMVSRRNVGNFTGTWKVVGNAPGGKVKAVRDWTPTEREAMGELKNVSRSLRKIAEEAYTNLNNGRLLKAVSENPEWAVPYVAGQPGPEGWVHIDSSVVKSNGVRKWGALADHWVEPSIAADLAAATNNDLVGQVVKLLRATTGINVFKKVKVVYNPASHGTQLMQNFITLEAAGGSVADVPRAARLLRSTDDPLLQQLRELGLYGDSYLSTEGMSGAGSADYRAGASDSSFVPRWAQGGARVPQWLDEGASALYQFSDDMTRTAYVLGKLDEGVPIEQAVREARERFYNGNTVNSNFARLGSASLLPFVKPALYTFDRLPELIEANPAKAVKLLAYWFAFDQGFKAMSGHLGDEEGRQALLPDYQKGLMKTIPLPIQDTKGQSLLFDYQRMNPVGSAFGINDRTGFGPVPEAFVPLGGPLGGGIQALMNRDAFRDEPLKTSTENRTPEFLAGHFMPGFTGNVQRLGRAIQGLPEYTGGPSYDVPTAAANLFGIKVQPFDPDINYDKNFRKFEAERRAVEDAINRLDSNLEGGFINEAQYERELADLEAQLDEINRRFEEWDAKAQRGLEAFGKRRQ